MTNTTKWVFGGIAAVLLGIILGYALAVTNDQPQKTNAGALLSDEGSGAAQEKKTVEDSEPAPMDDVPETVGDVAIGPLYISSPLPESVIHSPVTITGSAPGTWFFEGQFSAVLTDWDGKIIAEEPVTATGDWMTTELVPFSVTFPYTPPILYPNGVLTLKKSNPSGLPENDESVQIPINYWN